MKYRDYFTEYDEDEVVRFEKYLTRLSPEQIDRLYDYLIEVSIDANPKIDDTILDGRVKVTGSNRVEYSGSGEYSSEESSTYLDIYVDKVLIGELVYSIGTAFASESQVISLEFIEEETALAKLSERVISDIEVTRGTTPHHQSMMWNYDEYNMRNQQSSDFLTEQTNDFKTNTQENTMTQANTLRELTISLLDNNVNLEDDQRLVFQKKGYVTSNTNEEVKMEIIMSGEVKKALDEHNDKRLQVTDGEFLDKHGREVSLKEIKHITDSQLEWRFVETA